MKVTYDREVDAAYIYVADTIAPGSVKKTYECDPAETGTIVNIDLDAEGRILASRFSARAFIFPRQF